MSSKFNGFTQDEINKFSTKPKKVQMTSRGIRRVPDKKVIQAAETTSKMQSDKGQQPSVPNIIPDKHIPMSVNENFDRSIESTITSMQELLHFKPPQPEKITKNLMFAEPPVDESILHLSQCIEKGLPIDRIRDQEITSSNGGQHDATPPFRGLSLQDFQMQQKMIKEQNNQKKELLQKAIDHHSQKTVAEIQKIQDVKNELNTLDSDLAADVAILRKKIEEATIAYSQIHKAYEKVEAQFLKAKMALHQAGEKKELLTEHLCAVIAHNEDRKAKKLTELMEKLGLCPVDEINIIDSDDCDG